MDDKLIGQLVTTLAALAVGFLCLVLCVWVISRIAPFSIRKEIEEDQNVALGVIIGALILAVALIIAAGIHGT